MLFPSMRFGVALSSLRTEYDAEIKQQAWADLTEALKQPLRLPAECKISKRWERKAGFKKVLAFLRQQQ